MALLLLTTVGTLGLGLAVFIAVRWGGLYESRAASATRPGQAILHVLRRFCIGAVAGIVAGVLIFGLGGRLMMRIVAATSSDAVQGRLTEAGENVGEITFDGTVGLIIFVGVLMGFAGGLGFVLLRRFLPRRAWVAGLAYGLVLLVVTARLDPLDPENIDFVIVTPAWLAVLLVAVLFPAYGLVLGALAARLETSYPTLAPRLGPIAAHAPLAIGLMPMVAVPTAACCALAALATRVRVPTQRVDTLGTALLGVAATGFAVWFGVAVFDIVG